MFPESIATPIRAVVAAAVVLSPSVPPRAGAADIQSVLTPQSVAVVRLNPARTLRHPSVRWLPTEVVTAAGLEHWGIDPLTIETVEFAVEPPMGPSLYYAALVRLSEPFDLREIKEPIAQAFQRFAREDGSLGLRSTDKQGPDIVMLDDTTLLAASRPMMKKLKRQAEKPASGPFLEWLGNNGSDVDICAAVNYKALAPLARMALASQESEIPEQVRPFLPALEEIAYVEAAIPVIGYEGAMLAVETHDEAAAERLEALIDRAIAEARLVIDEKTAAELDPNDPVERAMLAYKERIVPQLEAVVAPRREATRFAYRFEGSEGLNLASIQMSGVLIALLLPAVQAAREAARRNAAMNQLKTLALAMHNYHDTRGTFPAQAICDDDGQPLLSWRVAVLPFIGEQALYDAFRFDEPWDSPHNRLLAARMPELFVDPSGRQDESSGRTHFLAVVGSDAVFDRSPSGIGFREITDGTSRTLAIVQVDDNNAVPWTKPVDYDVERHAADPVAGIGSLHPGIFLAAFCDGSVRPIRTDTDAATLRAMFTRNGREVIELP